MTPWTGVRNSLNSSSQHTTVQLNIQMESSNGSGSNKVRKVDVLFQLQSTRFGIFGILGILGASVLVRLRALSFGRTPGFFL